MQHCLQELLESTHLSGLIVPPTPGLQDRPVHEMPSHIANDEELVSTAAFDLVGPRYESSGTDDSDTSSLSDSLCVLLKRLLGRTKNENLVGILDCSTIFSSEEAKTKSNLSIYSSCASFSPTCRMLHFIPCSCVPHTSRTPRMRH